MRRRYKLIGPLAIIAMFCLITAANSVGAQTNRYFKDGVSFDYPSDWPLSDESDAQAQTLSLDRGQDEAKILVIVLRQQMNSQQLAQAQAKMTEVLVENLTQTIAQAGAQAQRSSVSTVIAGRQASGIRLRAVVKGEPGSIDVYWLAINTRLIHLILVGSDQELARASTAWNTVCRTLRVGGGAPTTTSSQASTPGDLNSYTFRRLTGTRVELYMDQWGRGYVHDLNNNAWVRIPDYAGRPSHHPQSMTIQIHPSFCKASDTMALMYAFGGLLVYDSSLYSAQNPNQAWVIDYEVSQRPQAFASISRSKVVNHIAQVNDQLALAAGTNWICVYDRSLHKWINYQAPVDDSTNELDRNLVLGGDGARVKILNGPYCSYALRSGSWRCQ